jgi:hypothetical protein
MVKKETAFPLMVIGEGSGRKFQLCAILHNFIHHGGNVSALPASTDRPALGLSSDVTGELAFSHWLWLLLINELSALHF